MIRLIILKENIRDTGGIMKNEPDLYRLFVPTSEN